MKKVAIIFLLLVAVVAAALVFFTIGKPAPKVADLLPESTMLFLHAPDFSRSRAEFAKTELYALCQEPEVQAFMEMPLAALRDLLAERGVPKEDEELRDRLLDLMQGEVFLAVTRVTILPTFSPGLVAGVDVRRKRIQAATTLHVLEKNLKKSYPAGTFQDKTFLGVKYSIWETQPGLIICHASLNSLVVFTLGEDTMRDLITSYAGNAPADFKSLAGSEKYRHVVQHNRKTTDFLAYVNVAEITGLLGPLLALSPQTAGLYEKLARIQTSSASVAFVDGGVEDVGFVAYSSAAPKVTPATQRKSLALTAPDTLVYWASSADLATTYDEAMQSLTQSGNANLTLAAGQFQQTLRRAGVRIREDVLQKIGPECAFIANWRSGATVPDFALVSEINDTAQLPPALDTTLNALKEAALGDNVRYPWDETEYAGYKLRTVHIAGQLLAPTYAATDQFFIIAGTPDYARELLAQVNDAKPTLAQSERYTQSMKRLPANGSSYMYADLRGLFEPLRVVGQRSLSNISASAFVDATKLPQSSTVAKHLFPFVSATVSEPLQETTTSFSPFGKAFLFIAGTGGAISAANLLSPILQHPLMPALPRTSSGMDAPAAPEENQMAVFQSPSTE